MPDNQTLLQTVNAYLEAKDAYEDAIGNPRKTDEETMQAGATCREKEYQLRLMVEQAGQATVPHLSNELIAAFERLDGHADEQRIEVPAFLFVAMPDAGTGKVAASLYAAKVGDTSQFIVSLARVLRSNEDLCLILMAALHNAVPDPVQFVEVMGKAEELERLAVTRVESRAFADVVLDGIMKGGENEG